MEFAGLVCKPPSEAGRTANCELLPTPSLVCTANSFVHAGPLAVSFEYMSKKAFLDAVRGNLGMVG